MPFPQRSTAKRHISDSRSWQLCLLLIVGLGFKVSLVPLHFWAPDVYEGAPTPVAGFLSTASKAAGFAVLARLFLIAFPVTVAGASVNWTGVLAILAAVTMTVGNLLALPQTKSQEAAGLLVDRPCRLCAYRDRGSNAAGHRQRGVLHAGLPLHQPGGLRNCHGGGPCHRARMTTTPIEV